MSKIDEYFQSLEKGLREDFSRRRTFTHDSDVKGTANETAVGEFLSKYVRPAQIVYNKQIIDSFGQACDEIDVCGCNQDQPAPETDLIIAEGVDFVVQVKAVLTGDEMGRIQQNASRLKRLVRRRSRGDLVFALPEDVPYLVDRVPYFVLAFESRLTLETAFSRASAAYANAPESAPDGIFILERGAILNVRRRTVNGVVSEIVSLDFRGRTLMNFLQQIHSVVRGIQRNYSPLINYFPGSITYGGRATQKGRAAGEVETFEGNWSWNSFGRALQLLRKSSPELAPFGDGGFEKMQLIDAMCRGDYPPETFAAAEDSAAGEAVEVSAELAAELSQYLRDKTGVAPDLAPAPRFGVPFIVDSRTLGRRISVTIKTGFFNDIQRWVMSLMSHGRPVAAPDIGGDLCWPPALNNSRYRR